MKKEQAVHFFEKKFHILVVLTFLMCPLHLPCFSEATDSSINKDEQFTDIFQAGREDKRNGRFDAALESFRRALSIAVVEKNPTRIVSCMVEQALMYWNTGKISESTAEYGEALDFAKSRNLGAFEDTCKGALRIAGYYNRAKAFRQGGEFEKSVAEFTMAIDQARVIASREHELKCLRQLSLTYWELADLQPFFSLNSRALSLAEELNHRQEQSKCLINLGLFYWKLDNYSEALRHYQRALNLARSINSLESQAECLSDIGIAYFDLGAYDEAMENLNKALALDKELKNNTNISKDLINIGESLRRRGLLTSNEDDFSLALRSFEESLVLAKMTGDVGTELIILNDIGATHSHLGNNQKALDRFLVGLEKSSKMHNVEAMGMILNNIGIVYSQLGNYEESTKYYQRAIDLALGISGGKILWEAYLEIADSYKKQGKWDAALENYRKSISVIENIRSGLNLEELKATFLGTDKRIDAYYNIIDLYIRLFQKTQKKEYEAEAFSFLEKAKARSFLDSIEVSKLNLSEGIDQKLLNRETELMNDISRLHTKLLVPQISAEQRSLITTELDSCENQLDSLKAEIREASPAYANLSYPTTLTLDQAQRSLIDEGTVYFAYLLGKENSYGFAIFKDDVEVFPLPRKEDIQKLVQEHLRAISDATNHDFRVGYKLYDYLIRPGLRQDVSKIIIVPDDALYFLPFETLLTKEQGREWLIKEYNIAYVPSLSSLKELLERRRTSAHKPQRDILAVGDPDFGASEAEGPAPAGPSAGQNQALGYDSRFYRLKYSGQEVEDIAALFKPKKREVLVRDQATEERLKAANLSDFKIIHFATHAVIDDKKPARSAIVLCLDQDPAEDGFVQMREVFNLRLRADLVTLSACETGLGRLVRGEGIEGLSRAFFYAGASSVLLSLWAINDQASYQLLERFYTHLHASRSIADALRKAKIEMINSGVLDHPYYWAGFIAMGDTERIVFPSGLKRWILATLSVAAGLAILLLIVNRDRSAVAAPKD
jgi:CHAT domain-containing protein/Tfp pilus assembly protein PilF